MALKTNALQHLYASEITVSASLCQSALWKNCDHGLEQLVHFPTRDRKTLDIILTST